MDDETPKWFPVLGPRDGCPNRVPWGFVAPHEGQALYNHDQTLRRLAERGGLGSCEMVAVVEGRSYRRMPPDDGVARLTELLAEYEVARTPPDGGDNGGTRA